MTLEIDITREDYSDFNIHHYVKTGLKKTILIVIITIVAMEYILNKDKFDLLATIVSISVCLLLYVGLIVRRLKGTKNIPKDDGTILGLKILQFNDDQIICKTTDSTSEFKWSLIKSVQNGKSAIYLYLDTNMAIIIPKRYFSDASSQENFLNLVTNKINVS